MFTKLIFSFVYIFLCMKLILLIQLYFIYSLGVLAKNHTNPKRPRRSKRLCPQDLQPSSPLEKTNSTTSLSTVVSKKNQNSLNRLWPNQIDLEKRMPQPPEQPPQPTPPLPPPKNYRKRSHHSPEVVQVHPEALPVPVQDHLPDRPRDPLVKTKMPR